MLSRPQQIHLKRAQQQAGIGDAEYRETLEALTHLPGCNSSKDARLTDEHFDMFMSYFEGIYWRRHDRQELPGPVGNAVFRQRRYWAQKNQKGNTSRDRYTEESVGAEVADLEAEMNRLGYGLPYLQAMQNRIRPFSLIHYRAALKRTLKSKRK